MQVGEFSNLLEFEAAHPELKKYDIAERLQVRPPRYSYLRRPDVYRPRVDAALAERIAGLLNQPVTYVRKLYPREAA